MNASIDFLDKMSKMLDFKIEKIENGNNIYEYTAEVYPNAVVIVEFELENELLDEFSRHIGYFGIDYVYKRIAYYIFNNIYQPYN